MNINDGEVDKEKGILHIGQLQIPLSIGQLKQLPEGIIRIGCVLSILHCLRKDKKLRCNL